MANMYQDKVYFGSKKNFYKGATHLHTTISDGRVSQSEALQLYKRKGYHFLVWSDHDIYSDENKYNSEDFITIGGCEHGGLNLYSENDNPGFHLGCIEDPTAEPLKSRYKNLQFVPRGPKWKGFETLESSICELKERGNLVVLNHPEWHMTKFDWVLKNDYFAFEIYNHGNERSTVSSYGTAYWDHALQNGKRVFGTASDDVHGYDTEFAACDYGAGFIVVNADKLDKLSIVTELKKGNFYSSSGPQIHKYYVENDQLHVECSECKMVVFKSWPQRSEIYQNRRDNAPIKQAAQVLKKHMKYIRAECIDFDGNVAWSNPVFLEDLRGCQKV